ncbi:MAG: sigma-70 family RNA polymerase sigma factor [Anaerolineales bacterium]|nr:sigma-70 family RNA polymerase sigma factor [Anaerolineales bacterium]
MFEDMDETQLIEQAKTDPEAFGRLYELYVDKIYNYIYYRLGNHHEAEDLTAKVFHRALNHIPHYNNKGAPFAAWLYRIAHNLLVNWRRDNSRRQIVGLEDVDLSGDKQEGPQQAVEQANESELLLAAIQHLPRERQELLVLKFVERMSNAEIGRVMGRSEGAIKSLYHRTLVSLKELLTEQENPTGEAGAAEPTGILPGNALELKELEELR